METIKAKRVNDFDFVVGNNRYVIGSEYRSNVSLLINNYIAKVCFLRDYNYDKRKKFFTKVNVCDDISSLEKAGVSIDYSDVMKEYRGIVAKKLKEDRKKAYENKIKYYDSFWGHKFVKLGCEMTLREKYLSRKRASIQVWIPVNEKQSLSIDESNGWFSSENYFITNGKKRFKSPEKLVNTLKECVLQYNAKQQKEKENKIGDKNKVKLLSDLFGRDVKIEEKYSYSGVGRYRRAYHYNEFQLKVNDDFYKIGFDGDMKKFNFAGFMGLSLGQVKNIISIVEEKN